MPDYTASVDQQISQLLRLRGRVTPAMLAGYSEGEGAALLARYVAAHSHEVAFAFDGQELTWAPAAAAPSLAQAPEPDRRSPVERVVSLPQGKTLLDTEPSGSPYPRWAWWPPIMFGLMGGALSWAVVRDANPRAAKRMLVAGAAVTVAGAIAGLLLLPGLASVTRQDPRAASVSEWPASSSGRVSFCWTRTRPLPTSPPGGA